MTRIWGALIVGLMGLAIGCGSVWAQATAQISGTVRDQSGAVLPGVEVTVTQTETALIRTTITNETGSYVLPNLPIGPYRFEAALPGFRTFVQTGIVLQVNSNPVVNPVLQIGQVTEQVEVQANAALVETRSTAVGQVMENERILELPLQGRVVTDLITLSGASVQTAEAPVPGFNRGTSAGRFISIAGGLSFGVMYSLDGAVHNNAHDGTQMPFPFPDALQEFKVESGGAGAGGSGRGSGGQVNAVTKSGTNEFHGNLFEFVRNYKF
ncbi:MAG: TonB-dependent receptor, partial [Acidobacteria bacterium]